MNVFFKILPLAILAMQPLNARDLCAREPGEELLTTGIDYAYGRNGRSKNEAKALECYLEAASLGNAEAAYRAARMYFYGIGTKTDKSKSQEYYTTAARLGHEKAAQELKKNFGKTVTPTLADLARGAAPVSVQGKMIVLDYANARIREFSHSSRSYGREKAWEWDRSATWEFDKSTTPTFEGGTTITYTKTGDDTATVKLEGWEFVTVYTLRFDSPTSGTAVEETTAEAEQWTASRIRFTLKDAPAL